MKDPENLICFLNALGKRIKEHKTDIATEYLSILIKSFEIRKEIAPGIINIAIPNIIPLDSIDATIARDSTAKKI